MNSRKRSNLLSTYTGFRGDRTLTAVLAQIPAVLLDRLTGAELGHVASAINAAYQAGRGSTQASLEDDAVWIGGSVQRLVSIADLPPHKQGDGECPYGPHATTPHPDGVQRG